MKLLVVTNLFHPDRGGGAAVFSDLCFGLAERGHDVTVHTTYPYYPEWRRKSPQGPWRVTTETLRGVTVRRYGLYVPGKPGRIASRLMLESSFLISLLRALPRRERFDAVLAYCPLMAAVAYGALRRRLKREPLWLNVQDFPADAAAASGISRSRSFNRLAQWVQRRLFGAADLVSSISPSMVERLSAVSPAATPLALFPNWLNGSLAECVAALPCKLGQPPGDPPRLLYAGNIGAKQGLLEACQRLARSPLPFRLRVCGEGAGAAAVRSFIEQAGDPRFEFGAFLDEPAFARALYDTDLFLITEKAGAGASFIPSKLIPCIATGTPIMAICDRGSPLGLEVCRWQLGAHVAWDESHPLASLPSGAIAWRSFQQNCLDRAAAYHRETALDHAESLLSTMLHAPSHSPGPTKGTRTALAEPDPV